MFSLFNKSKKVPVIKGSMEVIKSKEESIVSRFIDKDDIEEISDIEDEPKPTSFLGDHLIQKGLVTQDIVTAALFEQKVTGEKLGTILMRGGFVRQSDLVEAILELNPEFIGMEKAHTCPIPPDILEEYSIVIVAETDKQVMVGTLEEESAVREIIAQYYKGKVAKFVPFSHEIIDEFVEQVRSNHDVESEIKYDNTDNDVIELTSQEILDRLLKRALLKQSSDIHILPRKFSYTVSFRTHGVLKIVHEGSLDEYMTISAQAKDRSGMDLAERRVPQDGGFQIVHKGKTVDFRVATVPATDGEKIVIRVLDSDRIQPSLDKIGISGVISWRKGVSRQNGINLICGATGSGKTTTLNATLRELDRFSKSIYTLEDPVEYRVPYVTHVNTNDLVGLTFARGIKAFMRADPDIMILGEVRDEETARNAVKAADTGHLVIATLHTGSITGSVSRLRDLGIPPKELKYLLRSVLCQTLIRTICQKCKGAGCEFCDAGYGGRAVISECVYLPTMKDVERVIDGEVFWPSIVNDAVLKMESGITDKQEILRVFGAEAEDALKAKGYL